MGRPLIVLLSGYAGSGKDAAAALMMEEMGFIRFAFADALKEQVATETGLPLSAFHERHVKDRVGPDGRTPRQILLEIARKARATDPDIYARAVAQAITRDPNPLGRYVISDWRYEREATYLATVFPNARIIRVRITRPGLGSGPDPTEHDLDVASMDIRIANDATVSHLRDALHRGLHAVWSDSPSSL
jgi:hypothetical protein